VGLKRWGSDKLTVEINLIGDRPAGLIAEDSRAALVDDLPFGCRTRQRVVGFPVS